MQELAGHQDLATAQRFVHLSPAALDAAIRLLEMDTESRGGILEAAGVEPARQDRRLSRPKYRYNGIPAAITATPASVVNGAEYTPLITVAEPTITNRAGV